MEDMSAKEAGTGPRQIGWLSLGEDEEVSLKSVIDKDIDGALRIQRSPVFAQYANLIGQYTSRHMSFSNDILNAIAGVMTILDGSRQRVSSSDPACGTMYGLPIEFLDLALLWQPAAEKGVRLRRRIFVDHKSRPLEDKYQLPSWSWAAWEAVTEGERSYSSGVRYEDPFSLVSDHLEDYKVKKVLESVENAEERMRPLIRWYRFVPSGTVSESPQPVAPVESSSAWSISHLLRRPNTKIATEANSSETLGPERLGELRPVNGTGLGLTSDSANLLEEWLESRNSTLHNKHLSIHDLPPQTPPPQKQPQNHNTQTPTPPP